MPSQDLINIAPKRANWDLKRETEKKLAKLERKTQEAIHTLIRMHSNLFILHVYEYTNYGCPIEHDNFPSFSQKTGNSTTIIRIGWAEKTQNTPGHLTKARLGVDVRIDDEVTNARKRAYFKFLG